MSVQPLCAEPHTVGVVGTATDDGSFQAAFAQLAGALGGSTDIPVNAAAEPAGAAAPPSLVRIGATQRGVTPANVKVAIAANSTRRLVNASEWLTSLPLMRTVARRRFTTDGAVARCRCR